MPSAMAPTQELDGEGGESKEDEGIVSMVDAVFLLQGKITEVKHTATPHLILKNIQY